MSWNPYAPTSDAQDAEPEAFLGADDAEAVTVALLADGDLHELTITDDWRAKVDADALAQAVFTAYSRAERARLDTERERPVDGADSSVVGAPVDDVPEIPAGLLTEVFRETPDYVATFDESLRARRPLTSRDGNVTVTAVGGSVGSVAFDDTWLRFAVGRDIAETTRPLLAEAIRTGAEIDDDMLRRFPAVTEFRRLRALKKAARR